MIPIKLNNRKKHLLIGLSGSKLDDKPYLLKSNKLKFLLDVLRNCYELSMTNGTYYLHPDEANSIIKDHLMSDLTAEQSLPSSFNERLGHALLFLIKDMEQYVTHSEEQSFTESWEKRLDFIEVVVYRVKLTDGMRCRVLWIWSSENHSVTHLAFKNKYCVTEDAIKQLVWRVGKELNKFGWKLVNSDNRLTII
ncbi:hypothetical protein [Vampirovibrio sp.]|uniref:hypothetical protein n=1 Tax=Vampirovibrio sp. TaxID=2717857 RepID=UPI00359491A8